MGQLKTGILALQKSCLNMEPQIDEVIAQQEDLSNKVFDAAKRIEEGINTLVLYVMEKLKKGGKTFETEGAKPLKGEMDANVIAFGKGIAQAKTDVKAIIARLNEQQKASVGKLTTAIGESAASMTKLKGIAEKKKAKWLKSAKYKAKITGYLAALSAVDTILAKQTAALQGMDSLHQDNAWVERCYKFNQDMTLAQVKGLMSAGLQTNLKDFNTNKQAILGRAKVFRDEYKSLGAQFGMMKKWVEEADEMEAEAEEK